MSTPRPPVSPTATCLDMVYFPRMIDKIRLHREGLLPEAYHANLGRAMDGWTCEFLHVDYEAVRARVAENPEADNEDLLTWCHERGHRPSPFELFMFTQFMQTKGFRDELNDRLVVRKQESGFAERDEIQTFFDYIDADEGRL